MKTAEKLLPLLAILALIMKTFHLPGASVLLIVSLNALAVLYYMGFLLFNEIEFKSIFKKESYEHISKKRLFGSIIVGILLSIILVGILFKLQFYPGAKVMLQDGLTGLAIATIVALIYYYKNKSTFYKRVLKRIAIIGIFGLVLNFTPSTSLVDLYYSDSPEYAEILKKVLKNPKDKELRNQLMEMQNQKDK